MSTPREAVWDAIVIGGGVSGLAAADGLAQAGRSYVVLEAQSSLGGRARTGSEAHGFIDLGAAYVGEHQNFLNMYLQRFGVETFKVHQLEQEAWLYQHADGEVEALPGDDPYALPGGAAAERRAEPARSIPRNARHHSRPRQDRAQAPALALGKLKRYGKAP
jgi:monoamine oxidase